MQYSFENVNKLLQTLKDSLLRSFTWMDSEVLRQNTRTEWLPFLHSLSFLHAALRLRARLGRGGWNCAKNVLRIGNDEFMASTN